jgi:acetate kinase
MRDRFDFTMNNRLVLTLNAGSSTIKLGLYAVEGRLAQRLGKGVIDLRCKPLTLHVVVGERAADVPLDAAVTTHMNEMIEEVLRWIERRFPGDTLIGVAHRVVHGGDRFDGPAIVTDDAFSAIEALVPLAPLHQPQSIRLIEAIRRLRPRVPQAASFDTAFHRSQTEMVRRFALPRPFFEEGVKRYGFHGLSYKSIAAKLQQSAPDIARGRVVVAHLGSGASLCGLENGISRETSMGFSTLDGIPMATRCGALDPGVLIYLIKERKMTVEAVERLLYQQSGLLGISGISADSRTLIESDRPEAHEAIELFAFRIAREMAGLATTLGGLDGVVFTAGIGEHQPRIRSSVCGYLGWLGVNLDNAANGLNAGRIEATGSKIAVMVVETDEEQVIADEACSVLPLGKTVL